MQNKSARSILVTPALVVAFFGAALYFTLIFKMLPIPNPPKFGGLIYNYYFLSLLDGRFEIPTRIASFEGHYSPDGRAFIYYGLAPMLTRLLAWPFFDLKTVSLTAPTIYFFSVMGTSLYHFLFLSILARSYPKNNPNLERVGLALGVLVWLVSPGLMLCSNDSVYNEPMAAAYFFVACFVALSVSVVFFGWRWSQALLPLALAAGLTLHARPHLAIGLYVAVCLASLFAVWRERRSAVCRAALAVFILFFFGAILLIVNEARFGDVLQMHGRLQGSTDVQYGFVYWGLQSVETPRIKAFIEHGVFNIYRIVPNLMLYLFDLPWEPMASWIEGVYRYVTGGLGYIRIEGPRLGLIYMWLPWFVLVGMSCRPVCSTDRLISLSSVLIGALFICAYATVTFRYRVDLWPLIAMLSMFSVAQLHKKPFLRARSTNISGKVTLLLALYLGVFASLVGALAYRGLHIEAGWAAPITFERCTKMYADKGGFGREAINRLCSL